MPNPLTPGQQGEIISNEKDRWKLIPVVKWAQVIGLDECPYMRRWLVQNRWGTLRVHHFISSDDYRAFHDHPWWFFTIVLKGNYVDVTPCLTCKGVGRTSKGFFPDSYNTCLECRGAGTQRDRLHWLSVRFRPANHIHRVETSGSWTFVVTGPWARHWGFWDKGVFARWKAYLGDKGFAPCQD